MIIRNATPDDAAAISVFLKELTALGKRTSPDDETFVRACYIESPHKIRCSLADDGGQVLGFQSLQRAAADNPWGVAPGWGIIGTHIRPRAARRGVGRALFAHSRRAAQDAGLTDIDATIAADNPEALAFYGALGFETYRRQDHLISKRFSVNAQHS